MQTERADLYDAALQKLISDNRAFPCTCTRKDIAAAASAPHEDSFVHEGPIYPGTCANWQTGDAIPESGSFCWRFRPRDQTIQFDDQVAGTQHCNPARHIGAFPITQKNGKTSYQLAVVVDDALMGINEVVRGDDLIPSTFRQIDLYQALGYADESLPKFAHVPLVVGLDGRRLAKRHGDTRLSWYREQGVSAEQVVGWAAHSAGFVESNATIKASEVVPHFDWSQLNQNQVIVNEFPAT